MDGCLKDPHILSGSGSGPVLMHHSFSVQYLTVQDVAMFRLELKPIQISFQTQVYFRAGSAFKIKMVPIRIRIKTSRICHAVLVVQWAALCLCNFCSYQLEKYDRVMVACWNFSAINNRSNYINVSTVSSLSCCDYLFILKVKLLPCVFMSWY